MLPAASTPALWPPAESGWALVHELLPDHPTSASSLAEVGALLLYYQRVAQVSGQPADAQRARAWLADLSARLLSLLAAAGPPEYADQACLLAWLDADGGLSVEPALLHELDEHLRHAALRAVAAAGPAWQDFFFQVLRYFSLRTPTPIVRLHLQVLLDAWPYLRTSESRELAEPILSQTGQLLVLIRLARAGYQVEQLTPRIREGLRQLLATRRKVDFLGQHRSIFPDERSAATAQTAFGEELSWRLVDLAHALLLYQAHDLLQDPELAKFAELTGLHTLLRTTDLATRPDAEPLYRAAAALARLYRQLRRLGNYPAYLEGYEFWLDRTHHWVLATQAANAGTLAGAGHAQGLAEAGLVLLVACTPTEPSWEVGLLEFSQAPPASPWPAN
ncbi:hypothetical protein GCM10027422_44790 [Hymenobacter arcticus]